MPAKAPLRLNAYLQAGCRIFDLPVGILSSTPVDPETGEGLYRIEAAVAPTDEVRPGLTIPLRDAFAAAVVASRGTVVYADAQKDPVGSACPACAERGLRAYIGAPVFVNGDLYGALSFVSTEPRGRPFAPYEQDLIEVMAQAVGRQLALDQASAERGRSEGWARAAVAALPDPLLVVDGGGRVLQANPAARDRLGVVAGAALWPDGASVVGEDGAPVPEAELPERVAFATCRPVRGRVQGVAGADGTTAWYRVTAAPVEEGGSGRPDAVALAFHDVTDLRGRPASAAAPDGAA